jgi:hypothetical protein
MNKTITYLILATLLISGVSAVARVDLTQETMTADQDCQAKGFSYSIARWTYDNGAYKATGDHLSRFMILVKGTPAEATWSSSPSVAGVIVSEGSEPRSVAGGSSGVIAQNGAGIEQVTFCGNTQRSNTAVIDNPQPKQPAGVPEFSVLTLTLAIVIGGIGIALLRRN